MRNLFEGKAFDVEHALVMYATSYVTMPAAWIYESDTIAPLQEQIRNCHIYLIGLMPKVDLLDAMRDEQELVTNFQILNKRHELRWPLPPNTTFGGNSEMGWYIEDAQGERFFPSETASITRLCKEHQAIDFKVLYIGQAFGEDGTRSALDRLQKHETLQKIAVKGIPDGYVLTILMLAIEPANQLITMFNPWAKNKTQGTERIKNGLDKLFDTNEAERTTLYEASLIRYFQPPFNKEFKNSFPSTNMKLLRDCYNKDFSTLVAEISIDGLPFVLFSDAVAHKIYHIAKHDLHTAQERKVFFIAG